MEWNSNKYFDPTEPTERWKIRKSFMETHKDKYPEDRLICLAQVFCNIEFVGCSYNSELMLLVQNLAREVDAVMKYREEQKNAIKRTFLPASSAIKRCNNSELTCTDAKILKTDNEYSTKDIFKASLVSENPFDSALLSRAKQQPGWKGKIVIFENASSKLSPYATCEKAALSAKLSIKLKKTGRTKDLLKQYTLIIDKDKIEFCYAESDKMARKMLGKKVLDLFKKYCFTIVTKSTFEVKQVEKKYSVDKTTFTLPDNNIGTKIMKLMGWSGHGLGVREHGIQNPIEVQERVKRAGLGVGKNSKNITSLINNYLQNYIAQQNTHSLVFSPEFTGKERKSIHRAATRLNLVSKSFGKGAKRKLTVQRNLSPWKMIENLLAAGGSTNIYCLIKPTEL